MQEDRQAMLSRFFVLSTCHLFLRTPMLSKYRNGSLYGKTGIVATVEGNCCWKVYSRRGCRGRVKVLRLGEVEVLEGMTVKTAKAKEC